MSWALRQPTRVGRVNNTRVFFLLISEGVLGGVCECDWDTRKVTYKYAGYVKYGSKSWWIDSIRGAACLEKTSVA